MSGIECWVWPGDKNGDGYGQLKVGTKKIRAHRVIYESIRRTLSISETLDHLCRNRACVNPWHLEPVTLKENILRGNSPQAINARKTRCPRGHEYDKIRKDGHRECSKCRKLLRKD